MVNWVYKKHAYFILANPSQLIAPNLIQTLYWGIFTP